MEKDTGLPTVGPVGYREQRAPRNFFWRRLLAATGLTFGLWILYGSIDPRHRPLTNWCIGDARHDAAPLCPQPEALLPSHDSEKLNKTYEHISSKKFFNASVTRLQGAVRIPTETFDDLGAIGEDPRWDAFFKLADYLRSTYPLIHDRLQLENVNTHGLLYTWKGSDESLKPILFMAHQDVVPVPDATIDQWTYPPYDAVYDGKYVWGRGANDCKNQLTALMDTLELLLDADFRPKRTILLSFGFDEEASGTQGAGHLAPFILDRYGRDGIEAIVDEGDGYVEAFGRGFAMPGVAEKGYIDVDITVRTPGGHSSIPPDHTSIGILSEIITKLEAAPYEPFLDGQNPFLAFLQCGAEHAPDFPERLRELLESRRSPSNHPASDGRRHHDALAREAARLGGPPTRYLMQTSQAVDIISGGLKVNALPEIATALVDHRVNIGDTPETVRAHLSALVAPIARAHNLSTSFFASGDVDSATAESAVILRARDTVLDVAPVTPTDATAASPYRVLAGTIRAVFGDAPVVAPGLMTGNTDTRYYWALSRHIFRFAPGTVGELEPGLGNIHTVDERVSAANHIRAVRWFMVFVRNMDEARIEG